MNFQHTLKKIALPLALFLLSLIAIRFAFTDGFYHFHDEPHIANLTEMWRAASDGVWPPRWAPDFSWEFGHPFFNFNYPLPFYLGSLLHLVGWPFTDALKIIFLISIPLSGLTFYLFARRFFSPAVALGASILYVYTPYRAVDLYVRGAVGELWSFVFVPLVLWAADRVVTRRKYSDSAVLAILLAFLILSHNLSAIIFLPIVFGYGFLFALQEREKIHAALIFLASFLLGLGLSAYYWLPAVMEKQFLTPGTPFNFIDHFPFVKQLIIPSWGYGASVWGPYDGLSFQIGVVNLVAVGAALFLLIWRRQVISRMEWLTLFMLSVFAGSVFLMNIRSKFFWDLLPLAEYVQFPWRLLLVTTFSSAVLSGVVITWVPNRWHLWAVVIIIISAISLTFSYFQPNGVVKLSDDYFFQRFFARTPGSASLAISPQYRNDSEDYLPLPVWVRQRPTTLPAAKVQSTNKDTVVQLVKQTATEVTFVYSAPVPDSISVNTYYFPGWQAVIDEQPAELGIGPVWGQIFMKVPAGQHQVRVFFGETPVRMAADVASLAALCFVVFLLL